VRERNDHASVAVEVFHRLTLLFSVLLSQIGIDVEEKKRKTTKSISSLARRFFTPSEANYLADISDSDAQRIEFFKLWTLKVRDGLFGPLLHSPFMCKCNQ
jgi:phosphopantetheinyl transferase